MTAEYKHEYIFLSTPSARRATCERFRVVGSLGISIHALREEGDTKRPCPLAWPWYFYPRPPRGGRLERQIAGVVGKGISIHALREEGDLLSRRRVMS